jgi:hypothetical protein
MREWNLKFREDVRKAMAQSILLHPHLEEVIHERIRALLNFPPKRWYRVHFRQDSATFFPEPGQKVRFSGLADFGTSTVEITHFSIHE